MEITIIDEAAYLSSEEESLLQDILTLAGQKLDLGEKIEVDVSIVSDEAIHQLNLDYRQVDRPTDVLSFPLEDDSDELNQFFSQLTEIEELPRHLGDIIISYPRMLEQAESYGHSKERELAFLAVHGFLHLNGYDHETEAEEREMFALQEEVLSDYGLTR